MFKMLLTRVDLESISVFDFRFLFVLLQLQAVNDKRIVSCKCYRRCCKDIEYNLCADLLELDAMTGDK